MCYPAQEKRRHPRFPHRCPLSFVRLDRLNIGETEDLSLGGMKIRSRHILIVGETYQFTVVMDGRVITPTGRIVYLEDQPEFSYGAGVSFLRLTKDHKNRLSRFLSASRS
ncbi:MAG: PilZ domain-containing protein [Deltaproteobacteria bacterium]|nr:PilZ domain-containing protein [Deltaproteobacteria bacterium]